MNWISNRSGRSVRSLPEGPTEPRRFSLTVVRPAHGRLT